MFCADRDDLASNTEHRGGVLTATSKSNCTGLNRDMIWKILKCVCGLKFLLEIILIYLSEIIIFHPTVTKKPLKSMQASENKI